MHSFFYSLSPGTDIYPADYFQMLLGSTLKFGTLCFFIISGYLLGSKLDEYSASEFFSRRVRTVAKPWLFWSLLLFTAFAANSLLKSKGLDPINLLFSIFFESEYWFVLNYFTALFILVLFNKLNATTSGIVFAAMSLFYAANIYTKTIPTIHTTAMFGYVFFLWFGREVRLNRVEWIKHLMKLEQKKILLLTLIALVASIAESIYIKKYLGIDYDLGNYRNDPTNTLRISNQIYGILAFALIYNLNRSIHPKWIYPRDETFGLYLVHWPIFLALTIAFRKIASNFYEVSTDTFMANRHIYFDLPDAAIISLVFFTLLYFGTLTAVKIIRKTKFSWAVGKV